jgi:Uma2 family endonuclease
MEDNAMTATLTPPVALPEPALRLLTERDLALLPTELATGTVLYELHHGRLIIMPPPGDIHGAVESNIATALKVQGEHAGHGKARSGDVGIVLGRDPDNIVGADAVFITNARLPLRRSSEGYLETIPELIAEVRSRNDTLAYMARKANEYLDAGSVLVWVIDPIGRRVFEYRRGQAPVELGEDAILTAEDIIPGFRLAVRDVLAE